MKNFKKKWGVNSNYQLIVIFFVFAVTGSLSLLVADPLLSIIGLNKHSLSPYLFWPIRILVIFPIYQILILIVGACFGQFRFFWNFEKKMFIRLGFKNFKNK